MIFQKSSGDTQGVSVLRHVVLNMLQNMKISSKKLLAWMDKAFLYGFYGFDKNPIQKSRCPIMTV